MINFDIEIARFTENLLFESKKELQKKGEFFARIYFLFYNPATPGILVQIPLPLSNYFRSTESKTRLKAAIQEVYSFLFRVKKWPTVGDMKVKLLAVVLISDLFYSRYEISKPTMTNDEFKKFARDKPMPSADPARKEGLWLMIDRKETYQSIMNGYKRSGNKIEFTKEQIVYDFPIDGILRTLFPDEIV